MNKNIKNILSYVLVIVIALLIKNYIFTPIRVNGSSMEPTLKDGDIMILNEIGYHLNGVKRFDIVVVKKSDNNDDDERIIKRVIGLPGETVAFKDNKLFINGEVVEENFSHDVTHNFDLSEIDETIIPDDYYFVVGDNRGNSKDSRIIGLINKSEIKGKTSLIIFPFNKIGKVK